VLVCFLGATWQRPLPGTGWAAAFLFLAAEEDVRRSRVSNATTLGFLALAAGQSALQAGWQGFASALLGASAALALLVIPFARRWLGVGDVKAAMALGAFFGPAMLVGALQWSLVLGGVMALAALVARGEITDLLGRWRHSLRASLGAGTFVHYPPREGSLAASSLPFAVALGLGAAAQMSWPLRAWPS
jgi:prepilin peptidase CpaA